MASYSTAKVKSQTLSGTTVDTVTLTDRPSDVEVYNRTGTSDISFTVGVSPAAPTALGDDCYVVAPGQALVVSAGLGEASVVVKLIGNGNGYTVTGV